MKIKKNRVFFKEKQGICSDTRKTYFLINFQSRKNNLFLKNSVF